MTVSITATWLDEQAEAQRRSFRRALAVSAALHLAFGVVFALTPEPELLNFEEVISVNLVAALPAPKPVPAAAPAPAPKPIPRPAPAAPKPAPIPKKIILPKQAPSVVKKRKPKPKPLEYDDALASLRSELGESTPVPVAEPEVVAEVEAPEAPPAEAEGVKYPPETIAWLKSTQNHVRKSLRVPAEFMNRGLRTDLRVLLSGGGEIIGDPEIVRPSGDPYWDDNTVRALLRANPLPAPPVAGDWTFTFYPEESR